MFLHLNLFSKLILFIFISRIDNTALNSNSTMHEHSRLICKITLEKSKINNIENNENIGEDIYFYIHGGLILSNIKLLKTTKGDNLAETEKSKEISKIIKQIINYEVSKVSENTKIERNYSEYFNKEKNNIFIPNSEQLILILDSYFDNILTIYEKYNENSSPSGKYFIYNVKFVNINEKVRSLKETKENNENINSSENKPRKREFTSFANQKGLDKQKYGNKLNLKDFLESNFKNLDSKEEKENSSLVYIDYNGITCAELRKNENIDISESKMRKSKETPEKFDFDDTILEGLKEIDSFENYSARLITEIDFEMKLIEFINQIRKEQNKPPTVEIPFEEKIFNLDDESNSSLEDISIENDEIDGKVENDEKDNSNKSDYEKDIEEKSSKKEKNENTKNSSPKIYMIILLILIILLLLIVLPMMLIFYFKKSNDENSKKERNTEHKLSLKKIVKDPVVKTRDVQSMLDIRTVKEKTNQFDNNG